MSRWNILALVLYSHDGRRRDLNLRPGRVNIITGGSHSGKSALAEIIDYCMASSECHLPGVVRDATSWTAMVWGRDDQRVAIARQVPRAQQAAVSTMYWRAGTETEALLPATATELTAVGARDDVMRLIEEALGIGNVSTETLNQDRPGVRISARQVLPYILQDDDVIISKNTLLRGAQDERRRSIIDSIAYFLRVSDEQTAALEAQYRRLTRQLAVEERRAAAHAVTIAAHEDRAYGLYKEALDAGLIDAPQDARPTLAEMLESLKRAMDWQPGQRAEARGSELTRLYKEEAESRGRVATLRAEIRRAEETIGSANGFAEAVQHQSDALNVIDLFRDQTDHDLCPVCASPVASLVPPLAEMRAAQSALATELKGIQRVRPKLDSFIASKRDDLDAEASRLGAARGQIRQFVAANDSEPKSIELDHLRSRVVGRMSLYFESRNEMPGVEQTTADLAKRVEELRQQVDTDSKKERLEAEQQTIAVLATKILAHLPFEETYRDASVYFIARDLSCGISTGARRIPLRDVGSDENYLSLHLAVLFALHRFFRTRNSPVPGVLLLDQLSRPYYPADRFDSEVVIAQDTDALALRQYFKFLFSETRAEKDLQVIVLEHAYLSDEPEYVGAVIERWVTPETKLIPADWPRAQ
jgi:hypothetical protein